jgi:hypothetical protein
MINFSFVFSIETWNQDFGNVKWLLMQTEIHFVFFFYEEDHIKNNVTDCNNVYEDVSKRFRTGRLERELQMIQLSATRCSCIAILWVLPQ